MPSWRASRGEEARYSLQTGEEEEEEEEGGRYRAGALLYAVSLQQRQQKRRISGVEGDTWMKDLYTSCETQLYSEAMRAASNS